MKILFSVLFIVHVLMVYSQHFTEINGCLQVRGNQLCNEKGKPIQLKGFSTHNMTFCPECVTYDAIKSNRDFWGANVVRATVYVDDYWNDQTYNKNPELSKVMVDSVVRWSEQLGLYCIIDWHILTQGNPNSKIHAGVDNFFQEMSSKYARKKHILYEICNEPNGNGVTWDTIADYANRIISIIRKNDTQSVIIIGTSQWCQQLDKVQLSKLFNTSNIMYSFHFYAATHIGLLPMFREQIHRIPVIVTEWGVCENTGNGNINFESSEKYLETMEQHVLNGDTVSISWCNFSFGDKKEAASVLKPQSCTLKQWENMTPTGFFIREYLKKKK